jgi:hypothetical protein
MKQKNEIVEPIWGNRYQHHHLQTPIPNDITGLNPDVDITLFRPKLTISEKMGNFNKLITTKQRGGIKSKYVKLDGVKLYRMVLHRIESRFGHNVSFERKRTKRKKENRIEEKTRF